MAISESLMSEWRKFADRCTPRTETGSLNYRMFAVLVRNAALEEAAQNLLRNADKCSLVLEKSVLRCNATKIRNLKEPTP